MPASLRPSGHRSFVWHGRVQGEPVRATVGPAALMSVEDARKRALALSVGNAPRTAEGRSGAPLFRDFVRDEWLPAYRRRCAPSSCQFANRVLKGQLIPAFGRLPLDAIRRTDCCSARGLRADRRDKLLKWLDTGGQNCTPNNILPPQPKKGTLTQQVVGVFLCLPSREIHHADQCGETIGEQFYRAKQGNNKAYSRHH